MQKNLDKYFWDGAENLSEPFKLKRILEYASFPDLISYPFDKVQKYLSDLEIDKLRTSEKRRQFIKLISTFVPASRSWDDVFDRILDLGKRHWQSGQKAIS